MRAELATRPANWRDLAESEVSPRSFGYSERLLAHNAIVVGGTLVAGILGGVIFLGVFSHRLRPADYGAVFTVITLLNLILVPATALTLLMARETSRDHANGRHAPSTALLRGGTGALLVLGTGMGLVLVLASPFLTRFLDVEMPLLWAAAGGIPFTVALPLLLGELQGSQRFLAFSLIMVGQAALKLAAAVVLGTVFGPAGVIAGISIGTLLAYVSARRLIRRKLAMRPRLPWLRPAVSYLSVVLPSTLAIALLLSADAVIVKHFFSARQAGEFAAVAALGRGIFFASSGVAAVLFPKMVFRHEQRENQTHLVLGSLVLVMLGGGFGWFLLSIMARPILVGFAGAAYAAGADYLSWYAFGMTLLGAATVLIATHQSRGNPTFLAIVIPVTVLEPVLITLLHSTLVQVVQVMDGAMIFLVGGLLCLELVQRRSLVRTTTYRLSPDSSVPAFLPQIQPLPVQ